MEWEDGRTGGGIEDRRGLGAVATGGLGVGGVVLALVGYFVFGISPTSTLNAVSQGGAGYSAQQEGTRGTPADEAGRFVDVVATNVNDVWATLFKRGYTPPDAVVLYDQATGTGCGTGQSAMGPFYCPADRKVYLDLSFWQELETKFGAKGDAARAYVIAHEIGHHVQNLSGASDRARRLGMQGAESGSVRLELQADCSAGVWAAHAAEVSGGRVSLSASDIEDGIRAAAAVGDDTLQRKAHTRVVPDSFTHGTSAQRVRWFQHGYETGDPDKCDTFRAPAL